MFSIVIDFLSLNSNKSSSGSLYKVNVMQFYRFCLFIYFVYLSCPTTDNLTHLTNINLLKSTHNIWGSWW